MAYTFSEGLSTTYYSENKTALIDVLSLLPDNTNKEITPRDVRDAVFSAWENTVFKYVTVAGTEYVGFSRDEIKDKKIFFGKKQISGLNILDSTLLSSSEVDLFFYNTKSDTNLNQNFRAVFLAGTNSSLFTTAPFIQANQVSGTNNYISLNLVNPNSSGTIALQSGSSASVIINNLYFPSTASIAASVLNPSASLATDLFLAVRGGQFVELLTYNNGGGTYLTQSALLYSNPVPMVTSVGSFTAGQTFSNVPFSTIFDGILYPTLGPLSTIDITQVLFPNRTLERNHVSNISVSYNYSITKRSDNVTSITLRYVGANGAISSGAGPAPITGSGLVINNYSDTFNVLANIIAGNTSSGTFTFSVIPSDGASSYEASTTIEFVYPYIYAWSPNVYPLNNGGMQTLFGLVTPVKVINTYGSQSIPLINQGTPRYLYFMYPSIHGTLSAIKDGNDFSESLSGGTWTYSYNEPLNDPSGKWVANYNIFRKTLPVLLNPSQNYKFIF
jgi:hypothetical protein